jgi:RNA polymerase sigma factor (sigma-70 family)
VTLTSLLPTERPACRRQTRTAQRNELDDLLIAVGARRDGEAFTALFDHFRPRVQAQMVRLGLAPSAAEDLVQDVMETIWRKAHLYDPHQSAAITWVFQIARNRSIDVKRRNRELCLATEEFFGIPDPAEGCDECLEAAQRGACVRAALAGLPQEQVTLVRLAFFDGLSHSAIAQRLNLPLGTVKSRLRLACARLHRLLADAGLTEATLAP